MTLASIVSGIIKKEPKVDRKKLAYLFKDHGKCNNKEPSLGLLLRILSPSDITILEFRSTSNSEETDSIKRIQEMTTVLFPEVPITVIHYHDDNQGSIIDQNGEVLNKEKLMTVDVGLFIDRVGDIFVYKGFDVPESISFRIPDTSQEDLEKLRDADLNVLLPTENMWLVNELTRNREAKIAICYFGTDEKRTTIKTVNAITSALMNSSIKVCLSGHYFTEDFKDWYPEKEAAKLFDIQHDFVLAIRGDRIDVHLPFENGAVSKIPNGWLLLN